MAGLLSTLPKKPGLLANAGVVVPQNYEGTLGELPIQSPFEMKTSTQAIPDITTPNITPASIAQALPRDAAIAGITLAGALDKSKVGVTLDPSKMGPFGKVILGKDKIEGLAPTAAGYEKKLGGPGPVSTPLAILGATLPLGLDALGLGPERSAITSIIKAGEKEAISILAKTGLPEEVVSMFKPRIIAASTPEEAKLIIQDIGKAKQMETPLKFTENTDNLSAQITEKYPHVPGPMADTLAEDARTLVKEGNKTPDQAIANIEKRAAEVPVQATIGMSATDFIKSKGLDPRSVSITDNANSIVENLAGKPAKLTELPISVFGKPKFETLNQDVYTAGRKITDPIEVTKIGDRYHITDGANRFSQAVANGDKTIPVVLEDKNLISTPTRGPLAQVAPGAAESRPIPNIPQGETLPESAVIPTTQLPSVSLESVKQIPKELSTHFKQVVDIGARSTKEPNLYRRMVKKIGDSFTKVTEYVQNAEVRVRNLVENPEMKVSDVSNAYQKMTLYPGRVAVKIEDSRAQMESIANDIVDIADKSGTDAAIIRQDVNEYMQAIHAPERNAALGDGAAGITDAQAKATLERIGESPHAAEIKRVAEQARKLNEQGLILLRDSGVISPELFTTLTEKYKNHVPLNRIFEGDEITSALSVRGFDVRSTGIKSAKGSERQVADILSNIQHNYEQSVLRSEKNIVDQATLAFVRDNAKALEGLMDVRKPRAIGKTFDDNIILERTTDPSYLQLYEKGKPVWIKVHDPALAVAFKGIGREKLPTLLNAVGTFTRFYAGLATRFNPEFALPNKIRDLQETMIYMAAQKDVGFKGAAKLMVKDPASMKAVWDAIRGTDSAGARLYQEMRSMGGTTGGFGLSTRKQTEFNLDQMIETAKSAPKEAAKNVIQYIDNWNTVFEDSTRLSVYKQALSQGLSKERAAFLAKEASINFNRMGRGGPVINAIWMFSNASIQGSAKMIRAIKNPKVAAVTLATIGAATAAVNEWNDHIDPQWRDKITKWDRLNGLPIILPSDKGKGVNYVVIPVSWGVKPIKVMADYAYDAASGIQTNLGKMASDLFTSVADAYNPLGGTDAISALTPTILDVPVEIARNQSWSGSKIHPDFDKNAPKDIQYFSTLGETASGKAFIEGTKALQAYMGIALSPADMKYAFDQYIGGAGKTVMKTTNAITGVATGKPVSNDEYPFISRFYRTRTQEEVGQGTGGDTSVLKSVLENQSRDRFYATQAAEDKYTALKALPKDQAAAQFNELVKSDPTLAQKVASIAKQDQKGLTYTERLITQLGVADGQRALYLKTKFDALKSNTDKANLWSDYVTKGIITAQVADQISYLLHNPQ